jgi:hypothetical protein
MASQLEVVMNLVTQYGRMWARNESNFEKLRSDPKLKGLKGLYILYDGSTPVYLGRGCISDRLEISRKLGKRKRFWDYFSWFIIPDEDLQKDTEALLIKTLPYYLRLLNRKNENFAIPKDSVKQVEKIPDAVNKPKFVKLKKVG